MGVLVEEEVLKHVQRGEACRDPAGQPQEQEETGLAQDQSKDVLFLRAEREAQSEFRGASKDRVGKQAIQADDGDYESEHCEPCQEMCEQQLWADSIVDHLVHGANFARGQGWIDVVQEWEQAGFDAAWICLRSQGELNVREHGCLIEGVCGQELRCVEIDLRRGSLGHADLMEVADDADDVDSAIFADAQGKVAQIAATHVEFVREGAIDYGDEWGGERVCRFEPSALENGEAQDGAEFGGRGAHFRFDREGGVAAVVREVKIERGVERSAEGENGAESGVAYAGEMFYALKERLVDFPVEIAACVAETAAAWVRR